MTSETKNRITDINNGIIPEGYKKTKVGIVPVEWEDIRFQDITSKTGKDKNNNEIEYPVYSINNKTGFSPQDDQFENSGYSNTSKELYKVVYKNEFAYNPARINVGSIGLLKAQNAVIISSLYVCFKMNNKCNIPFFEQYFKSHRFNFDVNNYTEGSVREYLFYDNFSKIHTALPPLPEQQKIAEILGAQDKLIELQERKINQLKTLKKGYLQKMFPKKGCKYPELRFKGFTDAWEQRKLGEVIEESYNGQTPSRANDEYWNGDLNWLASGDLNRGIVTHTTEKITNKGLEDTRLRIVPKGTFVMAITGLEAAGTRGNCGILGIDTALNQSCMALFPNKKILDTKFLFQWYRKVGEEYGINYTQGTKQQSYNAELIQILPISFPNKEEQQKIADYFSNLDTLITLHQRKLDEEKQKKKALMQLLLTGKVRC